MIITLTTSVLLLGALQDSIQEPPSTATATATATERAASILDRHVTATGGAEAYGRFDQRTSRGTALYDRMDVICALTIHESRSTERHWRSRSEMLGDQHEGSTGRIAWSHSEMAGTRIERGAARARTLREAPIDAPARWREAFERVEFAGTREVDGRTLHSVTLVPREGRPETRHYDAQTGLHVETECQLDVEGNSIPTVITYSDYRPVDGLLLPHSIRRKSADVRDLIIELDEVTHEVQPASSLLELPAAVRELLE